MRSRLTVIAIILFSACARQVAKVVDGVVQDDSGRRVVAWIDPMFSQGPPHQYKSKEPGIAPDCGMKLIPQYADEAPAAREQRNSIRVAAAEVRNLSRTLRTTGRVSVDERRVAQVRAKFEGFVDALYVNFTGQPVGKGDPLLAVYSPELLATQNELILASRNHTELAPSLVSAARTRLRLWDMGPDDIDRVIRSGQPMRDVVLRSPVSGVVLAKNVVAGGRVMPADTLYELADISRLWVIADVYESELPYVRTGSQAQVTAAGRTVAGRVAFIGPVVAAQTRTASVRIEVDNAGGWLKPDMFADVTIDEPIGSVLAVPESAVMNTGTRKVVFLARDNGPFDPRDVTTGATANGFTEIRSGLAAGDRVAVDANFLLDSESRLRQPATGNRQP